MNAVPSPRQILTTLLPHLRVAAAYAHTIQSRIVEQPDKSHELGIFAAALTDADLSIQTFIEVLLLGYFPQLRFYGEEYTKSFNTKYFRATDFGEPGDYLITLDPIDGTRFYADGHRNYQIILNVLNPDAVEAALIIQPAENLYYYGIRGEGAFWGALSDSLEDCRSLNIEPRSDRIYLGGGAGHFAAQIGAPYQAYDVYKSYSSKVQMPAPVNILSSDYAGAILGRAHLLDGVAIAFLAHEAGCTVTTHQGDPLPPLHTCQNYRLPGLLIAPTEAIHQDLCQIVQAASL